MYKCSSSSSAIFCALLLIIIFGARCQTDSGTECRMSDGKRGFCLSPSECKPSLFTEPTLCEYSETGMKLCCSESVSDNKQLDEETSTPESNTEEISDRYFAFGNMFGHPQLFDNWSLKKHRPQTSIGDEQFYNKPKESKYNNDHRYDADHSQSFVWSNNGQERTDTIVPNYNTNGNTPVETDERRRKRISEIKCEEYSAPVSRTVGALHLSLNSKAVPISYQKCEYSPLKLIVGGEASKPGEFPHMAALGVQRNEDEIMWVCGGTLISEEYILTAAHCTNTTYGDPVVVRLGEHNLISNEDGAQPRDYTIAEVIPHPRYKKSSKYNDIALLRLSEPVEFSKGIRPACLHQGQERISVNRSIATGWGRTNYAGLTSNILMKVSLSIIESRLCNEFYLTSTRIISSFPRGIINSMICAGEIEGGVDTCFGDSGGPLQITSPNNQCVYYIVGITSFGKVCGAARSPGVYTRVSSFIPWIESVVW